MRALLLAAGEGTRLRPLTEMRPKPMLPIGGRPILEHQVAYLRRHGINEIAINLHYKPQTIVDYFGDGRNFGVSITYSHERRLLGSAGAARALDWYFTETFVVLYADVLTDLDLTAFIAGHRASGAHASLALHMVEDPWRCGIVRIDDDGLITQFVEKPPRDADFGNLANSGVYVVEPNVLSLIPPSQAFDFGSDLFPRMIDSGQPLFGYVRPAYVLDVGSLDRYMQAETDFKTGRFHSSLLEVQVI